MLVGGGVLLGLLFLLLYLVVKCSGCSCVDYNVVQIEY